MSSFTVVEQNFCKDLIKKLINSPICKEFVHPVDRRESYADDYYKIITHPMDLTTILNRLENSKYTSISEMKSDLNQIWLNAMKFNRKPSLLYFVADYLQKKCDKKLAKVPQTETELYFFRLQKLHQRMSDLLKLELPPYSYTAKKRT